LTKRPLPPQLVQNLPRGNQESERENERVVPHQRNKGLVVVRKMGDKRVGDKNIKLQPPLNR